MKIFGIIVWQDSRTPREIIKPETLPGNCWPLEGPTGYVVIKVCEFCRNLLGSIFKRPTGFSFCKLTRGAVKFLMQGTVAEEIYIQIAKFSYPIHEI